jgi:hypothetical protein
MSTLKCCGQLKNVPGNADGSPVSPLFTPMSDIFAPLFTLYTLVFTLAS